MYKDPIRLEISNKILPEKGKKHFYGFNDGVEKIRQVSILGTSIVVEINLILTRCIRKIEESKSRVSRFLTFT